jgi:hypothetical protein
MRRRRGLSDEVKLGALVLFTIVSACSAIDHCGRQKNMYEVHPPEHHKYFPKEENFPTINDYLNSINYE